MSDPGATTSGPPSGSPAGGPERRSWWLLAVVVAAALLVSGGAAAVVVSGGDHDPGGPALGAAPPVELATLPEDVAARYRFADAHPGELAEIPCFCGCQEFLAHEDLYDCFVRPNGAGYEPHAAGCGVCLGEAALAADLLAAGTPAVEVRQRIIAQFGTTPITSPDQTVPPA